MEQPEIKVGFVQTKSIMTKSNAPLGGYSVNPYVGCPHACKYCYASFMKRFMLTECVRAYRSEARLPSMIASVRARTVRSTGVTVTSALGTARSSMPGIWCESTITGKSKP